MEQIKDEELLKFPPRESKPSEKPAAQAEMEAQLLAQMTAEMEMQKAQFQPLDAVPSAAGSDREKKLDLLMGISLPVSIELGRTHLEIRTILDLTRGSIIEFDKMASEPVDVIINGKKMAEGEVVVIDKHFAIRITSLAQSAERAQGPSK
jgi:flagellar motor switch protein FliN/FliY